MVSQVVFRFKYFLKCITTIIVAIIQGLFTKENNQQQKLMIYARKNVVRVENLTKYRQRNERPNLNFEFNETVD